MTIINGVNLTLSENFQADIVNYAKLRGINEAQAKTELENALGISITLDSEDGDIQFTDNTQEDLNNYAKSENSFLDEAKTTKNDESDTDTTLQNIIKEKRVQQDKINNQLSEIRDEYNSVKQEYNQLESEISDSENVDFYKQIQAMTLKKRMNKLYDIMEIYSENSLISMLNLG